MEQPPGSVDDLQPQDLSTSSIPTVIDLTRKGEECVLSNTSFNALHMVKSPAWYPDPETGSSDTTIPSGDPVQPDNAFSHTTVTLSYVSRSRVFSSHDSVSLCSPRYGVPPISRLSLHPPCDLDKGLGETGYALNQHYLEQVDGPMDLACQTELFQAQVGSENDGGVCPKLEPQELNGGVISSEGDMDKHVKGKKEHHLSQEKSVGLENGQGDSCSSSGICAESSPETLSSATGKDEERDGTEVLFLMSKRQDNMGARDLSSLSREYISPLEDPVSPSATSLDNVEDVFILPQASSSPSGDNSCLEATEEVAWDGMRTNRTVQPGSDISSSTTRLGSSAEHEQPVQRQKAVLDPLICLTDDVCVTENQPKPVVPHMNGNTKALQRTLKKKKLPVRSDRGTRLEAIVMNINSSRYKVSGCIRTSKKETASKSTASEEKLASPERNDVLSVGERTSRAKAHFLVKTMKQKAMNRHKANNINTDSTSDSELSNTQKTNGRTPPKSPEHSKSVREPEDDSHPEYSPQISPIKSKRKPSSESRPQPEPEHLPHPEPSAGRSSSPLPSSQSPKKSKCKGKATGSKTPPTAKRKRAHKRRQKKAEWSPPSSMFSPKEPEIKLKYVNYKEERRDLRFDSFSPFIRVERQQSWSPLCTVVNYPEEVRTQERKGPPCGLTSAAVPSTSCLQLGRVSMHGQHQRALVCCLCGQAANAMDLGDLHGPYYPEGYQLSTKTPASMSDFKEEEEDDYSDSNSSSCSFRGRRRKCAVPPRAPRPQGLKQRGVVGGHSWAAVSCSSPAAKRARSDAGSTDVEDWYSPPLLPLEPCEYWLHEDCAIWSAGVFLVKGRVYGLEEAVKVAQETKCSACSDGGASLGCFFKACPNKYHYRCALESDCVLIEDNFSMKCKKHKNKTLKASAGSRWDDR